MVTLISKKNTPKLLVVTTTTPVHDDERLIDHRSTMSLKKPKCLTLYEKSLVIEELDNGVKMGFLSRKYGVAKSTIWSIKQRKETILDAVKIKGSSKRKTLKTPDFPLMEKQLYRWYVNQRKDQIAVDGTMMRQKAKSLHAEIQESAKEFSASDGWLQKFKNRYGILFTKADCNLSPPRDLVATELVQAFDPVKLHLDNKTQELGLRLDQLYSVDEIVLYWKQSSDNNSDLSAAATAKTHSGSQRLTFVTCTNASGNHKLKPLIIGRREHPGKSLEEFACPVDYQYSSRACLTAGILKKWFHQSFVPQVTSFLSTKRLPIKALLLINSTSSYANENKLRNENEQIITMHLPPLKAIIRKKLLANVIEDGSDITKPLKILNANETMSKLMAAWQHLDASVILNCWRNALRDLEKNDNVSLSILSHQDDYINDNLSTETFQDLNALKWTRVMDECEIQVQKNHQNTNSSRMDSVTDAFNVVIDWAQNNGINVTDLDVLNRLRGQAVSQTIAEIKIETKIS